MLSCIFDTETTGIPKHPNAKDEIQPRVIEFGAVLANEDGEIIEEMSLLIKPVDDKGEQIPLEDKITEITGLTDEDLVDAPVFEDVAHDIARFVSKADALIAHNLPFDKTMMELDINRCDESKVPFAGFPWPEIEICTVQEHADEWGYRPKLIELYEHYTGEKLEQTHRAVDDVKALTIICQQSGLLL